MTAIAITTGLIPASNTGLTAVPSLGKIFHSYHTGLKKLLNPEAAVQYPRISFCDDNDTPIPHFERDTTIHNTAKSSIS